MNIFKYFIITYPFILLRLYAVSLNREIVMCRATTAEANNPVPDRAVTVANLLTLYIHWPSLEIVDVFTLGLAPGARQNLEG